MTKTFIYLAIICLFVGCQNDTLVYKYQDYPDVLPNCEVPNQALLKEAIYSFENDLFDYIFDKERIQIAKAYAKFIGPAVKGEQDYDRVVSTHSLRVFEELKKEGYLWDTEGRFSNVNYNTELFNCIAENIQYSEVRVPMMNLLKVNSMRSDLVLNTAARRQSAITSDVYMKTFIALELYYGKFFGMEITPIDANKTTE